MPRFKEQERNGLFLAIVLDEQIQPGTYEFALNHLVDSELDLSALDAQFNNDETGASAYDPRVLLKIVLLAYSRGIPQGQTRFSSYDIRELRASFHQDIDKRTDLQRQLFLAQVGRKYRKA
jgi:hypothetical protein